MEDNSDRNATALIFVTPVAIFLAYFLTWNDLVRSTFGFDDKGSTGDFVAGMASPIIGYLSAILIYLSFRQQLRANQIQIRALEQEIKSRKDESMRQNIRSGLDQMRSEINSLVYKSNIDDHKEFSGRQALEMFAKHFVRNSNATVENNENILDSIQEISILVTKLLVEAHNDNPESAKANVDEVFYFYSLKIAKTVNSLSSVQGFQVVDNIRESKIKIGQIFRLYGYDV